jgi:NAD(P)H-dependent FMN reductase
MKILILNGSPRRKGVTSTLLTELAVGIDGKHEVEIVRIHDLNMKPCIGCLKCRPDKTCILPRDDSHSVAEAVKNADLLVIGSPVYWGNMPGPLKVFFDRNVPLFEYCEADKPARSFPKPQLKGKTCILIVCVGSPFPFSLLPSQCGGIIRSLKTILKAGGIKVISVLRVSDSFNFEKKKEHYLQRVRRIACLMDSQ